MGWVWGEWHEQTHRLNRHSSVHFLWVGGGVRKPTGLFIERIAIVTSCSTESAQFHTTHDNSTRSSCIESRLVKIPFYSFAQRAGWWQKGCYPSFFGSQRSRSSRKRMQFPIHLECVNPCGVYCSLEESYNAHLSAQPCAYPFWNLDVKRNACQPPEGSTHGNDCVSVLPNVALQVKFVSSLTANREKMVIKALVRGVLKSSAKPVLQRTRIKTFPCMWYVMTRGDILVETITWFSPGIVLLYRPRPRPEPGPRPKRSSIEHIIQVYNI